MIRIMADGEVQRWIAKNRLNYGEKLHEKVMKSEVPLPDGIGLPRFQLPSEG